MNSTLKVLAIMSVFLLLFGCLNFNDNSLQKMDSLQQKYFVKQAFSTNQSTMTEYISSLAELKKNASNDNAKIIQTELSLAESFAYENRALVESIKLNPIAFNCSSIEAKTMIQDLQLAFNSINSAQVNYDSLNDTQKEELRTNYVQLLVGYKEKIVTMKDFVDSKC